MLNPILFTENVIGDFLKYQLTTYAFADPDLYAQMRRLLNLDETRHTPLLKGPYISLSRAFRQGPPVEQLVSEGILHPHLKNLIPHPTVYGHKDAAFRSIKQGRTTLVTINQDMKAFIPSVKVDVSFLGHMLCGAAEELQTRVEVAGHGTCKLETPAWSPLPIPVPSPAEQRRIVARLDVLAAKQIELRRLQTETEALLAAFTPALLTKAFREEL